MEDADNSRLREVNDGPAHDVADCVKCPQDSITISSEDSDAAPDVRTRFLLFAFIIRIRRMWMTTGTLTALAV